MSKENVGRDRRDMIPYAIMVIENEDDRNFMAVIYEKYNRLMYNEIYLILNNRWQVEDVMHATVVRLIDKISELREKDHDHLINYIIVACRNQAKNYLRDNVKHKGYSFDDCIDLPDKKNNREEMDNKLIHVEDLRQLAAVWDMLDERSRYVLEGYYILEKTMPQLAYELNIKPESVRMVLSRARKNAFRLMED